MAYKSQISHYEIIFEHDECDTRIAILCQEKLSLNIMLYKRNLMLVVLTAVNLFTVAAKIGLLAFSAFSHFLLLNIAF